MTTILDILSCALLQTLIWLLNRFPIKLRIWIVYSIIRLIELVLPGHDKVARRNLAIVFPNRPVEWREEILKSSRFELAHTIVDFARLPTITREWFNAHVETSDPELVRSIAEYSGKGPIICASGHLGSFEMCGYLLPYVGMPIYYVARNFTLPRFDRLWNRIRQQSGNGMIPRRGALKGMLATLKQNKSIGILFDQNITRDNAVFVNWFGVPAATTKAMALAALRTKARVVVVALCRIGNERYRYEIRECRTKDLYESNQLSKDDQVKELTERASALFEELILRDPPSWFWMHRRWKTRPDPSERSIYE